MRLAMIHSSRLCASVALVSTAAMVFVPAAVVAQDIPEGQSCGGLVCDLGLFGHKVAPKPAAVSPPPAAVAPTAPAPTRVVARPAPESNVVAEPRKSPAHKKSHVAKAVATAPATPATVTATASPATATPAMGAPPVAATLAPPPAAAMPASPPAAPSVQVRAPTPPARSPIDAVLGPQPDAASLTAVPPGEPAVAAPAEPVVLANPYVYSRPQSFRFQSVDPSVQ